MKIIETPRGALQGVSQFISTEDKARFINSLLKIGFHTIDVGAFVSNAVVPQLSDTAEVLKAIDLSNSPSKLLVLVGNERGADRALEFPEINYIAFPFSASQTFAQLNANGTVQELYQRAIRIQEKCLAKHKEMILYFTMAFGNPYGESWSLDLVAEWIEKFHRIGIRTVQLSDTTGMSDPDSIKSLFGALKPNFSDIEFGLHLRTEPHLYIEKVDAAYKSGCQRFDTVINGMGGHPKTDLQHVGNLRTGSLIAYLERQGIHLDLNRMAFLDAVYVAKDIFPFVAG